jgi:NAD(P)-dependent dehydrogenase (short-subunit alcohol dehydrogenase family)
VFSSPSYRAKASNTSERRVGPLIPRSGLHGGCSDELAAKNVRVTTVLPTGVPTGMVPPSFGALLGEQRSDLIPIFVDAMPTPAVEPTDVSNAVLFLISDESRYVTGLQFKVDAGVTIN